jgi:hypothetical protein
MFSSTATIQYRNDPDGPWVTAWMDQGILDYYFTFIPKCHRVSKPRWKAHATVIRPEDKPNIEKSWGKYEGDKINLLYDPYLWVDDERKIWWFNLWSEEMDKIRVEMECSIVSRITKPPRPGYKKCFHCTIATSF